LIWFAFGFRFGFGLVFRPTTSSAILCEFLAIFLVANHPTGEDGASLVPANHPDRKQLGDARQRCILGTTNSRSDLFVRPRIIASRKHTSLLTLKHQTEHVDVNALSGVRAHSKGRILHPVA